jgi:hypothetical protein
MAHSDPTLRTSSPRRCPVRSETAGRSVDVLSPAVSSTRLKVCAGVRPRRIGRQVSPLERRCGRRFSRKRRRLSPLPAAEPEGATTAKTRPRWRLPSAATIVPSTTSSRTTKSGAAPYLFRFPLPVPADSPLGRCLMTVGSDPISVFNSTVQPPFRNATDHLWRPPPARWTSATPSAQLVRDALRSSLPLTCSLPSGGASLGFAVRASPLSESVALAAQLDCGQSCQPANDRPGMCVIAT